MGYKKIIWTIFFLLFVLVIYFEFIKPHFDTKKASFDGVVIAITKPKRTGSHLIKLMKDNFTFSFYYGLDGTSDISIGDSVFKNSESETLYVKSLKDGLIRRAKDQDFLVPPRARQTVK
ncbi:hypothetical protein [Lacibacter sp. H407]|jgi:hypothetical protein|uniref:hypothetical protein n=1 Tax=Lacibacter sp. H407 TaxID=3133423 RepID=UPI0030C3DAD1